jgi:hypothetical protein
MIASEMLFKDVISNPQLITLGVLWWIECKLSLRGFKESCLNIILISIL